MLGAKAFWIGKQLVLGQHLDRVQRELFRLRLLTLLVAEAFWKTYSVLRWFLWGKDLCKEAATNLFRIPVIYEEKDLRKEVAANLFRIPVIYEEKICARSLLSTYLGFQ